MPVPLPASDKPSPSRRGRPPGLSSASREMILNAAEDLFGRKGIDGVSLREIAETAGQRNNSVVRYHFQTKVNLVSELLADRIGKVERARQQLVDQHLPLDTHPPETLLRLLWEPLLNVSQRQNEHRFVRLLLACQLEQRGGLHPLATAPEGHPASNRLLEAVSNCFPHVPREQCLYRLGVLAMMFWSAVTAHDEAVAAANLGWSSRFSLGETIKLAVAALHAPA
jgi:AcrR family transcriptional regulator